MSQKTTHSLIIASLLVLCGIFVYAYDLNEKSSIELSKYTARQYMALRNERSEHTRELEMKALKLKQLQDLPCTVEECLSSGANGEIYGTATIRGYYTKSIHTASEESKMCDEIVVTGGSSKMMDYLKGLIGKEGDASRMNEDGYLVINIDPSGLDLSQRNILIGSAATKSVDIVAIMEKAANSNAPICRPLVDILKVKKVVQPKEKPFQYISYGSGVTEKPTLYENDAIGFTIMTPKGWLLPSIDDVDPHFRDGSRCWEERWSEEKLCRGIIEIQGSPNPSDRSLEQEYREIEAAEQKPVILSNLIRNARVIRSIAPGPAEGWSLKYSVFFENERRYFVIFASDISAESVISTLKITK